MRRGRLSSFGVSPPDFPGFHKPHISHLFLQTPKKLHLKFCQMHMSCKLHGFLQNHPFSWSGKEDCHHREVSKDAKASQEFVVINPTTLARRNCPSKSLKKMLRHLISISCFAEESGIYVEGAVIYLLNTR